MTASFDVDDVREMLAERADEVLVPLGLASRAVESAGRVRRRRRAMSVVAGVVLLVPLALQLHQRTEDPAPEQTPTQPQPRSTVVGPVVWSADLPGLDLPVGAALEVPYGVGNSLFLHGDEHSLPGAPSQPLTGTGQHVIQIADTPLGVFAVTVDGPVSELWLLEDGGTRAIGGAHQLTGLVSFAGTGDEIQIAFGTEEGVHAGPIRDPQLWPTTASTPRQAVGFLDGDPVFGLLDDPGSLERLHRASTGEVTTERIDTDIAARDGHPLFAGWVELNGAATAVYTGYDTGCTYAYRVRGSGEADWHVCDARQRDVMVVGPRYGAVGSNVYDLADSGALVTALDVSEARFDVAPIGWESPTELILRVASFEPYDLAGVPDGGVVPPRYIALRCHVETGSCERLPHPVDVIAAHIS